MGRVDDVIKVSGHRIGAAEVETAWSRTPRWPRRPSCPMPHDIKGEAIYAYVTLKTGVEETDELKKELVMHVRHMVGPIAVTRRHPVRARACPRPAAARSCGGSCARSPPDQAEELGDITTLADPSVVDKLVADHKKLRKK